MITRTVLHARSISLGVAVFLLLLGGCRKPIPKAITDLRAKGWTIDQLDKLATARKADCDNEELKVLAEHAAGIEELEVEVAGSKITDEGLSHLRSLNNVVKLDVSSTKVSTAPIAGAFATMRTLKLDKTGTTDEELGDLKHLTRLKLLTLSGCKNITGVGLDQLATLQSLEQLKLDGTSIDDEGLRKLPAFAKLKTLYLDGTKLTDTSLPVILRQRALTEVSLEDVAEISDEALDEFEEANEEIQVTRS